jgi:glycosyltransferase involved in cell wall biosynthesis
MKPRLFYFSAFTIYAFNIYHSLVRILQISSARTFGGGERHLIDLCLGLTERGHEVFVALRPTNEWQERFDFLPKDNFLHVSLRNSFGVLSAQRIAEFINENKIEVVHAHLGRDYIPASLACRIAKDAKFILTRHVLFPMKPFQRLALGNLSKAIAVSGAVEENLQKIFPKKKISMISNGIAVENWANIDDVKLREEFRFFHNIPFDAQLVGTVGELKILKGQRDFVLAAQEIAKNYPNAYFAVVGRDNSFKKEFRRELKRLVKIFGLENRFLFLDWVEETAALMAALDVYVSPSHSESFGLATLEAMIGGKAIVASETDGAKELLQNDFSGKIVPIIEPAKLAEAIGELLRDENLRLTLGRNAREIAKNKYCLETMISETEKIYKEALTNS